MARRRPWLPAFAVTVACLAGAMGYLALQEVPTAVVLGTVLAEDSGRPLPNVTVQMHQPGGPAIVFHSRPDGSFRARRVPAGAYLIEASARAHALHRTALTLAEGEVRDLTLELPPVPPFLDVRLPQHVFLPEETPQISVHGFVPEAALEFRFFRVDLGKLYTEHGGSLEQMLHRRRPSEQATLAELPGFSPAGTQESPITRQDVEGVFHQRFELSLHDPGLYVVEVLGGPTRSLEWVMVTRLGLVVKSVQETALAYVADLKTGAPVAGATVTFVPKGAARTVGVTDAQGLFEVRRVAPAAAGGSEDTDREEFSSREVTAWAEKDGSQAVLSYWGSMGGANRYRIYTYTDRPVYRPGHRGFFNGIARAVREIGYSVPAGGKVEVEIRDPRGTLLYRNTLTTDRGGAFHDGFSLSDEAATGYYTITTRLEGESSESGFQVAEYRKPEFQVEVKTDRRRYTRGETLQATVSAEYYFGAPAAGAEVQYQVTREPYFSYPGWDEGGGEGEYGYSGELVDEGTVRTDDQGRARISVPTRDRFAFGRRESRTEEEEDQDEWLTIRATVTDVAGREVTEEGGALVTQGEFALDVEPARWVAQPGVATDVTITARTYEGKPVRGVRVTLAAQPEYHRRGEVTYGDGSERVGTTDASGKATVTFSHRQAGYFRLLATAYDPRGHRIRARSFLWVTSDEYADYGIEYPDLEIVPDKREYRKGDTATLLINTQHAGGTALFTIEGPRLFERRLVQLKAKSTRVTVPIQPEYAPNVYASVALVRDKQFATQETRLMVSVADRALKVEVRADKPRYAPGERATYTLLTRDAAGRPVPAHASIGVVDESVYAIQEETALPILEYFYSPRGNSVSTVYSFPSFYLDANKEAAGITVRRRFPDTAYWNPTVITGADGRATVSFALPDTLTTWRATVRAATLATEVGQSVMKVQTSKELLVRLETPRFFVQNDRLTIAAVVHNTSPSRQEVQLWIRAPGITFDGGRRAPRADSFRLEPGKTYRRDWQIEAPAPGDKEITVYAKARSGLSDAMALTIPALPHGREQVEARSGTVTGTAVERLMVRADAVAGAGDLRLRITPSLAGVIFGALDYLAAYPYGCTEQTMSAFLPDVVVAGTLRELRLSDPKLSRRLPDMVRRGLDRLYGLQHEDGGWGWWRYDETDPWMTAYVVYGLLLARENGFDVNEGALNRALDRLTQYAQQPRKLEPQHQAFLAQVLARGGRRDAARPLANSLYNSLERLNAAALARLAQAMLTLGRTSEARALGERLWSRATESGALLWWPGAGSAFGHEGTGSTEITALAFQSLHALAPDDPRLPKVVRWLVLRRQGNAWESTRDTAFAIYAITPYVQRARELQPDYQATVQLGSRVLLRRRITAADVNQPEIELRVPFRDLVRGPNTVRFTKSGTGNLYYTAVLTQSVYQEDMTALVGRAGISMQRQYFRLRAGKDPQGGGRTLIPSADPTTDLRLGESVLVRLTVRAARAYEYMVIEDPLPSGAEAQDRGRLEPWEWDQWYADVEVRDEKVAFFARELPAGKSVLEYYLRPQFAGEYHVMPAVAYSMYAPDIRGASSETRVRIR